MKYSRKKIRPQRKRLRTVHLWCLFCEKVPLITATCGPIGTHHLDGPIAMMDPSMFFVCHRNQGSVEANSSIIGFKQV